MSPISPNLERGMILHSGITINSCENHKADSLENTEVFLRNYAAVVLFD